MTTNTPASPGKEPVANAVELPGQIPPFLSAPTFNDREEERVCINGCLYLRADFAARLFAKSEQRP